MNDVKKYLMFAAIALFIVLITVIYWKVKKIFREHPQVKKTFTTLGKILQWTLGILTCIALCFTGIGVFVLLGLGAYYLYRTSSKEKAQPETPARTKARKKSNAEKWLEDQRRMNAADMAQWQERKAKEERERQAARAEAERLESEARHWENVYRKTGTYYDKQKAESSRARANEAHRKAW